MVCFASHGVPCDFVPIEEAEIVDGWLTWRGKRYGGAVRYFMATPEVANQLDFIIALEHAEGTTLFGAYVAQLFTSKGLLADLYQDDRLTADQRRLLDHSPVLLGPYVVDGADGGGFTKQPITGTEDDLLSLGRDVSLGCVMSA